ncbi:unnamed protein product [Allacma fusca]|uniref:Tox-ART-HYD1 domain-containing protein n=1 Tax=Allacma fusca TaxID=39272 RepID=A0A8J2JHH2_9HEXA|nr:unnamed protein product [Allacma fusca]
MHAGLVFAVYQSKNSKTITMVIIYHYTTTSNAIKIENSGVIYQSKSPTKNAAYGKGVYLTSLSPSNKTDTIALNNHTSTQLGEQQRKKNAKKAEVAFEFDSEEIGATQIRSTRGRDIWVVHDKDIILGNCAWRKLYTRM